MSMGIVVVFLDTGNVIDSPLRYMIPFEGHGVEVESPWRLSAHVVCDFPSEGRAEGGVTR